MFKNNSYEEKINKSIIFLLVSGILGVVMSNILFLPKKKRKDKNEKKKNKQSIVGNGLWLGGILLIVTSIFVNWQSMSDDIKLIMIGITLVALIYYSKKMLENEEDE
jgi:hypothetical protein